MVLARAKSTRRENDARRSQLGYRERSGFDRRRAAGDEVGEQPGAARGEREAQCALADVDDQVRDAGETDQWQTGRRDRAQAGPGAQAVGAQILRRASVGQGRRERGGEGRGALRPKYGVADVEFGETRD